MESMKRKFSEVEKLSDDEWRAQLKKGDYCDHLDEKKWREAQVTDVSQDGSLSISWRGMLEETCTVDREDASIAKPYTHTRDWRNQVLLEAKSSYVVNTL